MNLLNSRTWLVNPFIKSDKSRFEFIKHVYISWMYVNLNLLSADFLFLSEVYSIMSCVVSNIPVLARESDSFCCSTETTLARAGISAFTYDLPLAGIFLSVADTLLLVLLVCFCHPSMVHLPLGRAITASLTLMMLSLVVPLLANLVSSCQRFFSPYRTYFYMAVESESYSACRWLMECSFTVEPYASAL